MSIYHLPPRRLPGELTPLLVDQSTPLPSSPRCVINIDGSCNPNPGPMGIGYCIHGPDARQLVAVGSPVGKGTNNKAEYLALISALRHALRLGLWDARVFTDSLLLVNQLAGRWKVKQKGLRRLHLEATMLSRLFESFSLEHVPRESNGDADDLSRKLVFNQRDAANALTKRLEDWQVAFIRRQYFVTGVGPGVFGRIFGKQRNSMEKVCYGQTRRGSTFNGYDEWIDSLLAWKEIPQDAS